MASHFGLRLLAAVSGVAAALLLGTASAAALTPTITEFSAGLNPGSSPDLGIAPGPDGNVWFTDGGGNPAIGRITPTGEITEFSAGLQPGASPESIAAGPDGNLWFTDPGGTPAIGRITPTGEITEFSAGLKAESAPFWISPGPDGNLWFTEGAGPAIGRITPMGVITLFSAGLNAGSAPTAITLGADGNLWFGDGAASPAIGRVTTTGAITEFSAGLQPKDNPYGIAAGADGNVWFSDSSCPGAEIGRVTPAGGITKFTAGLIPESCPYFIGSGPDGALWFTDEASPTSAIGRITTAGEIAEFSAGLNPLTTPYGIGPGPDGNVWFTDNGIPPAIGRITTPPAVETGSGTVLGAGAATVGGTVNGHSQLTVARFQYGPTPNLGVAGSSIETGSGSGNVAASARLSDLQPNTTYRYRLEATNPTGTTQGATGTFTTFALPVVSSVKVEPTIWRRGRKLATASKRGRRPPVGTRIAFTLNRAAPVRLAFLAKRRGRRGKPRLRLAGSISLAGKSGRNTVRFQGRLTQKKKLKPGNYRVEVTASDPTVPNVNSTSAAGFTIVAGK